MKFDPWEHIPKADHPSVDNVKVADPSHPLLFRRGKDFYGRNLFFLEGKDWEINPKDVPRLSGIEVEIVAVDTCIARLVLTLLEHDQLEIFCALCSNLLKATQDLAKGDCKAGASIVINRMKRWQDLLKKRSETVLSKRQIMGLVGELLFLREILLPRMTPMEAVNCWTGPFGDEQDFVVRDTVVEVKTQMLSADRWIRISSENQLDNASTSIFLWYVRLGVAKKTDMHSTSLNELVESLMQVIKKDSLNAIDSFNAGLLEVGYSSRLEYDDFSWVLVEDQFIAVTDEFPKITPADLPEGIQKVTYSVDFDKCKDFVLVREKFLEGLFGV